MNRIRPTKHVSTFPGALNFSQKTVHVGGSSLPAVSKADLEAKRAAAEKKRRDKALMEARSLAETPACEMIAGGELRAAMFVPYVLGRLATLRAFGVLDWRLIDEAARLHGVSWREFVAVEFVRTRLLLKSAVENGNASCWRGSAVRWWKQAGEASALTGTWIDLNRTAAEMIEGSYDAAVKLGGTAELHAEYLPVMELFALGAVAAVDAREARIWKDAELASFARRPRELKPWTLLPHMIHELAQFRDEPDIDWSEIDAAAAAKGRTWRAFIAWALIRHFIAYTGLCWWQTRVFNEVQKGQCPDLWAIVNREACKVNEGGAVAAVATSRAGIPGWME